MDMSGQWTGSYLSKSSGMVVMNLEAKGGTLLGALSLIDGSREQIPAALYRVIATETNGSIAGKGKIDSAMTIDMRAPSVPERVTEVIGVELPKTISFKGRANNNQMEIAWTTEQDATIRKAGVGRADIKSGSTMPASRVSWDEFRREVRGLSPLACLFRGQERPWPLRTGFHRSGRIDLMEYPQRVMRRLQAAVSTVTSFMFPLRDADGTAALLALAQHHGYPTPLLDWTWSPYVAAYFACQRCMEDSSIEPRVIVFDARAWETSAPMPSPLISSPYPTLRVVQPVPLHNPRVVPQQSAVTITNLVDIESFLLTNSAFVNRQFVRALDLKDDPKDIMVDLRMMGISAAALFPGLDGLCRGLNEEEQLIPDRWF